MLVELHAVDALAQLVAHVKTNSEMEILVRHVDNALYKEDILDFVENAAIVLLNQYKLPVLPATAVILV
jgi:hypothetical protein